jgi:hypothetical protein
MKSTRLICWLALSADLNVKRTVPVVTFSYVRQNVNIMEDKMAADGLKEIMMKELANSPIVGDCVIRGERTLVVHGVDEDVVWYGYPDQVDDPVVCSRDQWKELVINALENGVDDVQLVDTNDRVKDNDVTIKYCGIPGHHCCSSRAKYHLNTIVSRGDESYVVSTVGLLKAGNVADEPYEEVSAGCSYETLVFKVDEDGLIDFSSKLCLDDDVRIRLPMSIINKEDDQGVRAADDMHRKNVDAVVKMLEDE